METVVLTPLPCWAQLSREAYRRQIVELIADIEQKTRGRHQVEGTVPAGATAAVRQDPHTWPVKLKRSPAPAFHAASPVAFQALRQAYAWFVAAYREAAERLRKGIREANFPVGAFPPALPFVVA